MASIRIDISNVNSTLRSMKTAHSDFNNTKSSFSKSASRIDYTIRQKEASNDLTIDSSINTINNKLNSIDNRLKDIERVVEFAITKYTDTENKVTNLLVKEYLDNKKIKDFNLNGGKEKGGVIENIWNKVSSIFDIIDTLSSKVTDFIEATTATFNAMIQCIIPYAKELKLDFKNGTYRVLGKAEFVKDLGLARWYKPSTVASKPNVDKIFKNIQAYDKISKLSSKLSGIMDNAGKWMVGIGAVFVGVNEFFFENKGKPVGEKVTDTTIEIGIQIGKVAASTAIGTSVGTWAGGILGTFLGGPLGTAAGAAVGAALGTGIGIGVTWLTDKVIDKVLDVDLNNDGKGFKDTVKDLIGNAANNVSEFIGNIEKNIMGNGIAKSSNQTLVYA